MGLVHFISLLGEMLAKALRASSIGARPVFVPIRLVALTRGATALVGASLTLGSRAAPGLPIARCCKTVQTAGAHAVDGIVPAV